MDEPPSLSSAVMSKFSQLQPQVVDPYQFEEDQYNPSMSKIRSLDDQPQPDHLFEAGTVDRGIGQPTETYGEDVQAISIGAMALGGERNLDHQLPGQISDTFNNGDQAPSVGSMVRDSGNSQTVGGNFSYDAPPSHSDLGPRDASHTGGFSGDQNLPEGNYEGMSLTGRNFGKSYPMPFQKQEDLHD